MTNTRVNAAAMAATPAHTLRLPKFYRHNPLVWFSLIEQHFVLQEITRDDVKFSHDIVS